MYCDGHCHLTQSANPSLDVKQCLDAGITSLVLAGTHLEDWHLQLAFVKKYATTKMKFFLCFGIHPWFIDPQKELQFDRLTKMLGECDAIGETGLDYFQARTTQLRLEQQQLFSQHLCLAKENHKPLMIHTVRSHHDCLKLLKKISHEWRGMVHSFIGSWQEAQQYLKLGFFISIGPHILRGARAEVLKKIPEERLIIESDAPQINKVTGKPTTSLVIIEVAKKLAEIRKKPYYLLLGKSQENIGELFNCKLT